MHTRFHPRTAWPTLLYTLASREHTYLLFFSKEELYGNLEELNFMVQLQKKEDLLTLTAFVAAASPAPSPFEFSAPFATVSAAGALSASVVVAAVVVSILDILILNSHVSNLSGTLTVSHPIPSLIRLIYTVSVCAHLHIVDTHPTHTTHAPHTSNAQHLPLFIISIA